MRSTDDHGPTEDGLAAARRDLEGTLRAARTLLGMDVAWIAEFRANVKVFRIVEGDADSFGFSVGAELPLAGSYCHRVATGSIPGVIPDTALEPGVRDLDMTADAGIGAFVGVPIALQDGTVYGTLCVASHRARNGLSVRDAEFLRRIGHRVAERVDQHRGRERAAREMPAVGP